MSRARVVSLAVLLLLGVTSLAHAQANPPGYDAAIDEALAAFDHGSFSEARELFLRAHKILPSARTLRALGKAEYELKRYDEAATHLSLALDSDVRRLTEQQRSETSVLLSKCEDFLATYTLRLSPADAELKLDGSAVGLDSDDSLRLVAGEHVLEAEAPSYLPWRRELSVEGRVNTVLSVDLSPVASTPPVQEEREATHVDHSPRRRRWLLWTSVGVVVAAGIITGVVVALNRPEDPHASGGNSGVVWTLER